MEFKIVELEREPIEFDRAFQPGSIDYGDEAEQTSALLAEGRAEVLHEHRGPKEIVADIRLKGRWEGNFEVPCARCVEPVPTHLNGDFDLIFRPLGADAGPGERSISAVETEIGYYQKDSLLLEDVLREQVLLSLPVRTLCKPDCKGLCPRCGQNRNRHPARGNCSILWGQTLRTSSGRADWPEPPTGDRFWRPRRSTAGGCGSGRSAGKVPCSQACTAS